MKANSSVYLQIEIIDYMQNYNSILKKGTLTGEYFDFLTQKICIIKATD